MDATPVLQIIRLVASEFSEISDEIVSAWIRLTAPFISKKRFGNLYYQALALLTAHRMKMANVCLDGVEDPMQDIGSIGVGNLMRVGQYSEGETSIGFNTNIGQFTETNADLALTQYGIQYLSIRRMRIVAIVSAGEHNGRP